jgi:hypothetical protein
VADEQNSDGIPRFPVAELLDEPARRPRRGSHRVLIVGLACLLIAAVAVGSRIAGTNHEKDPATDAVKTISRHQARINVFAALDASIASKSFNFSSRMSQTAGDTTSTTATTCDVALGKPAVTIDDGLSSDTTCYADSASTGMTLDAHGTINLDPLAMVATSNVGQYGEITSWVNSTSVWERGGGQYGMTGPEEGPGAPLSGFAGLVESTLGPREGGVAMMSLASPTGYLNLARQAITDTSSRGTGVTSDGVTVHEYEVTLDAAQLVNRPGMSDEQIMASTDAYALLHGQGYTNTTIRIGIDDDGLIRESASVVHFADGGAINATVTFSDFGCAGTVAFPGQSATTTTIAESCTGADPAASTTTTSRADVTTTTAAASVTQWSGTYDGIEHFGPSTGTCADLDHHLDSVFSLEDGSAWKFHSDYCGILDGNAWQGTGPFTFTLPDGALITGDFADAATIPSPGVRYRLNITGGTGNFEGASGSCQLDNHLRPIASGEQQQYGTFTCYIRP